MQQANEKAKRQKKNRWEKWLAFQRKHLQLYNFPICEVFSSRSRLLIAFVWNSLSPWRCRQWMTMNYFELIDQKWSADQSRFLSLSNQSQAENEFLSEDVVTLMISNAKPFSKVESRLTNPPNQFKLVVVLNGFPDPGNCCSATKIWRKYALSKSWN